MNNILYTTDSHGYDREVELPTKEVDCPNCDGKGRHIHNAFREEAFTEYDAERDGLDFEEEVCNMRSGMYDVTCNACHGSGRVSIVDTSKLTPSEREEWYEQERDRIEFERECRFERMMGC